MSEGSEAASARPPGGKLPPVWELVVWSYESVLRNWRDLVRALALPGAVTAVAFLYGFGFLGMIDPLGDPRPVSGWIIIVHLVLILSWTAAILLAAISWHRFVALGPAIAKPPLIPRWRMRTWRYLGYCVLLGLIASLAALVVQLPLAPLLFGQAFGKSFGEINFWKLQLAGLVVLMVVYFVIALVWARLLPVLPAAAVDHRLTLRDAVAATRGAGLRIAVTLWLTGVPVFLLSLLLMPATVMTQQASWEAMHGGVLQPGQLPEIPQHFYWITGAIGIVSIPVYVVAAFAALSLITRVYMDLTGFTAGAATE